MCKFYCMSNGPSTNLDCLHCGTRYCAACLHGEAGKMKNLISCAGCGKKPRTKAAHQRGSWDSNSSDSNHLAAPPNFSGRRGSNSSAGYDQVRRGSNASTGSGYDPIRRGSNSSAYSSGRRGSESSQYDPSASRRGSASSTSSRRSSRSSDGGSIFDRLTDPSLYTGAHKHRFDSNGFGRGLGGRDKVAKGGGYVSGSTNSAFRGNTNTGTNERIHDISQVLVRR